MTRPSSTARKVCSRCKLSLPHDDFNARSASRLDGLFATCRACCRIQRRERAERVKAQAANPPHEMAEAERSRRLWHMDDLCWHHRFAADPCGEIATWVAIGDSAWKACDAHRMPGDVRILG